MKDENVSDDEAKVDEDDHFHGDNVLQEVIHLAKE